MKQKLLLLIIMSLFIISFASAETTIIDNPDNTFLGSVGGGSGLIRTITFEYLKPLGQIDNASIQLKIGKTPTTNYSIPQSCLDRNVLSFQYRVDTATFTPATTNYYCTNTTNGLELITSRTNYTGDTNTPAVTTFGEQARAYDNDYNTGVLGYNFEFYFAPTTAITNSQRADSVFYEQDLILEHTGSLTPVCDSDITTFPCYLPSGYTWNINPGTYNINDTIWIEDGVTINGNGATLVTTSSAPIRINGTNTNINNLNINGSVNGAILIYDPASNGVIDNINCDVNLYCVRFLTGGDDFDVTNINGEALIIANANDIYVNNYTMNADIVSSASSLAITDSTNVLIENSEFTGVDSFGDGMWIAGQTITTNNITLRNNVFNDQATIYSNDFGSPTTNVLLDNNVFNSGLTLTSNDLISDNHVFYNNVNNGALSFNRPLCDSSMSYIPCNINQNNLTLINGVYDFGKYQLVNTPAILLEDDSYLDGSGASITIDNYNESTFVGSSDLLQALGGGGITNTILNASSGTLVLSSQTNDETFYLNNSEIRMRGDIGFGLSLVVTNMRYLYIKDNIFVGRPSFETSQFFYGSEVSGNTFLTGATQPSDNHILMGLNIGGTVSSGLNFYDNNIESGMNQRYPITDFFSDTEDVNNVIEFRGFDDKYVIITYYDTTTKTHQEIKDANGFTTGVYYGEGFGTPINFDIDIDTSEIRMRKNKVVLYPGSNMDKATLVFREISDGLIINGTFTENYVLYKDAKPYFNQSACAVTPNNLSVECGVSGYGVYVVADKITDFDLSKLDYYWDFSSEYSNETAVFDRIQGEAFELISGSGLTFVNSTRGEALDTTGLNFLTDDIGDYNNKNVTFGFNARVDSTSTLELLGVGSQPNLASNPRSNVKSRINYWEIVSVGFLTARVNNNLFNWDNWFTISGQDNDRIDVYGYDFDQRNTISTSVIYEDYAQSGITGNPFLMYTTGSFGTQENNYLALGFGFSGSGASLIDDYYISNTKLSEAEILYIQNNELDFPTFDINITNIDVNTTIVDFDENLLGVCDVNYTGFGTLTYNYTWLVNGLPVTDSFLSPNTPIFRSSTFAPETTTQYTYEALSNDFLYDPIVTTVKSQTTCGINYRLELGDQIYQRAFGVFHVNYGITPYSSIGSFPFTINDTYIDNGNVTFNLTSQFACALPGAYVEFEVPANELNSLSLDKALFSDGDEVTFTCSVTDGTINATSSSLNNITVLPGSPQSFNVNDLLIEDLNANETIYIPFSSVTLNSTGRNFEFGYSESDGEPIPRYNVWLSNGVVSYEIALNTSSNNFVTNLDSGDILLADDYFVRVQAFNSEGSLVVDSVGDVNICVNSWIDQYTSCFNDTQVKTYIDSNLCSEQYDRPLDHNTTVSCDDGILSVGELDQRTLEFKENLLVMIIMLALGVGLIVFYMASRSSFAGILTTIFFFLVSLYLFYQYPSDWILGVGALIVSVGFGISSLWLNRET